ncbi:hypothetical protein MOQ_002739 [Trypanosoma cruzi marinkellei]|uniref:TRUD domain-containing protein n=1 Tax=Trypanosoma cruzi marinkellei TaxID=85056 RepID=K2NEJ7_TRYCR|nr:hypothetical protein MOQ_002739 [Trypanosoma cruzi marinkellei]
MLRACGITEFFLPVEKSATARIKERPEDFIVVEVDPTGARTDAEDYQLPISAAPLSSDIHAHNAPTSAVAAVDGDYGDINDGVELTSLLTASDVLTDATREKLLAVFGSKQDAILQYASGAVEKDPHGGAGEYLVAVLNRKEERRRLHHALKHVFPHLRTETRRVSSSRGPSDSVDHHVIVMYDTGYLLLAHLLGESAAESVEAWSSSVPRSDTFCISVNLPPETTKEKRRALHELISRRYPGLVCLVANGQVTLKVALTRHREKRARDDADDASSGLFTHLLVRKRNLDMMKLRLLLSRQFDVSENAVCTAGLKDKCAVTYQRCSVPLSTQNLKSKEQHGETARLVWPGDPSSYAEILQLSEPCATPVGIGQLNGNWFSVRLVDVRGMSFCELVQRVRHIESNGFLNYFGQQRFSEHVSSTKDHVGLHLMAGRWAEAVQSILSCVPGIYASFPERMKIRYVQTSARDAVYIVQALQRLHRTQYTSPSNPLCMDDVANCTSRWQQLCHDALLAVPYNIRVLWVNAAQSLIFNIMLSKLHGMGSAMGAVEVLPLLGHQVTIEEHVRPVFEQTLTELDIKEADVLEQKKVLGVPIPGAVRQTVVRPTGCRLTLEGNDEGDAKNGFDATVEFFLPPSSYATIFLREALGFDRCW